MKQAKNQLKYFLTDEGKRQIHHAIALTNTKIVAENCYISISTLNAIKKFELFSDKTLTNFRLYLQSIGKPFEENLHYATKVFETTGITCDNCYQEINEIEGHICDNTISKLLTKQ